MDNSSTFNDRSGSRFGRGMISHSVIRVSIPTVDCIFPACWLYPRVVATLACLAFHKITITRNIPSSKYPGFHREFQPCRVKLSVSNVRMKSMENAFRDEWKIIFFDNSILLKKKSFAIRFRLKCVLIREMDFILLD